MTNNTTRYGLAIKNSNFILRDHLVHGVRVLPGVTYLDMVYRLGKKHIGQSGFQLQNILFKEPLATDVLFDQDVQVCFQKNSEINYEVSIRCRKIKGDTVVEERWHDVFSCMLFVSDSYKKENYLDIERFIDKSNYERDIDEVYASVRSLSIEHGEFMQTFGRVYQSDSEELMLLSLSDMAEKYLDRFYAHPALLDASTLAGSSFQLNKPELTTYEKGVPYIPFSIDSFSVFKPLPSKIYVHSVLSDNGNGMHDFQDFTSTDIYGYGSDGQLIFEFRNLVDKRIRNAGLIQDLTKVYSEDGFSFGNLEESVVTKAGRQTDQWSDADNITGTKEKIRYFIQCLVCEELGTDLIPIDANVSFYDLGLDSVGLLNITKKLENYCKHELYPTLLFENKNVAEISEYLFTEERIYFESGDQKSLPHEYSKKKNTNFRENVDASENHEEEIAIVGMAGRYPASRNIDEFWEVIIEGENCTGPVPDDRWSSDSFSDSPRFDVNRPSTKSKWGAFVSGVDEFDSLFFSISPKAAESMDPQLRVMLEVAWHAMEHAGYTSKELSEKSTGVYVGVMNTDFTWLVAEHYKETGTYLGPGSSAHELSNQISYHLDLHGPSLTVQNACTSSSTAIHLAVEALRAGSCDVGLAGGVNLNLHQQKYWMLSQLGIISSSDKEKTFDISADGYVPGEGAGMVMLKRLSDAKRDNDQIHGVLLGSAISHSGKGSGRYVPDMASLSAGVQSCLAQTSLNAHDITYLETHGSGTNLGDPVEVQALAKGMGRETVGKNSCALGTKASIGHLESASGICSLTKVLLSIKNGVIPCCANIDTINPGLRLDETHFYIPIESKKWDINIEDRVAGVHSFGVGGSSSFMLVRGEEGRSYNEESSKTYRFIPLSAKSENALVRVAENLLMYLGSSSGEGLRIGDIAYTLQIGREEMNFRVGFQARDLKELLHILTGFCTLNSKEKYKVTDIKSQNRNALSTNRLPDSYKDAVDKAISKNDLSTISDLWMRGVRIPWHDLYYGQQVFRIALPQYPFEQRKVPLPVCSQKNIANRKNYDEKYSDLVLFEKKFVDADLQFKRCSDKREYVTEIILFKGFPESEYSQIFQELFDGAKLLFLSDESIRKDTEFHVDSIYILGILQDVIKSKPVGPVMFRVVSVAEEDEYHHCALEAIFQTAKLENPKFNYQFITIDSDEDSIGADDIVDIVTTWENTQYQSVFYKGSKPYVWKWEKLNSVSTSVPWKEGGVYLITGGLGGVGTLISQNISEMIVYGHLYLLGRSELNSESSATIEALRSRGVGVSYNVVDIADECAVKEYISELQKHDVSLDGILHCAGGIRDNFIVMKTEQELTEVLQPKVNGMVNLDLATKDLDLDFFVSFSSTSGVFGNVGQADYAAANSFLDFYSVYRNKLVKKGLRTGRTLSINWPYWEKGGMTISNSAQRSLKEEKGIVPLGTSNGLKALCMCLNSSANQIMVFEGEGSTILRTLELEPGQLNDNAQLKEQAQKDPFISVGSVSESGLSGNSLMFVESDLRQRVANLLKIEVDLIESDTELVDFGFESITITQFTEELNNDLDIDLTPSVFFEFTTLSSFTGYLCANFEEVIRGYYKIDNPVNLFSNESEPEKSAAEIFEPPTKFSMSFQKPIDQASFVRKEVAIIGMSGQFPKALDLDAFWKNLVEGRDCVDEIPENRWNWKAIYGDSSDDPNTTKIKYGGFIDGVDMFDPLFFQISPREAELMDPQQRLVMTHVWTAIEDAGYAATDLSGSDTSLFIATANSGYDQLIAKSDIDIEAYSATGVVPSVGPNRISYWLNLNGPSEPVETACSSSLVAIHKAVESVRVGESTMSIAGGVNTIISPEIHIGFDKAGMLSEDGRCKTFDESADGYGRGEGVGILLFKELEAAERDHDHIYAIVRASSVGHGGKTASLTSPSPASQSALLHRTYKNAGISPSSIGYIETHGTGTKLGDPIEISGLQSAFAGEGNESSNITNAPYCALGSVKSNIGHLELAAGVAGVCKVLLQLKHKTIVKSLHVNNVNPYIKLSGSPFYLTKENSEWRAPCDPQNTPLPRRAGVSSFGFGGVNAHVVLEEYIPVNNPSSKPVNKPQQKDLVLVLSAKNEGTLRKYAKNLHSVLNSGEIVENQLSDVAFTLQVGREAYEFRLALIVDTINNAIEKLTAFIGKDDSIPGCFWGHTRETKNTLQPFDGDVDFAETIKRWAGKGKYLTLADLWVKGLELDWRYIYENEHPYRISLPTYPFEMQKCWVTPAATSTLSPTTDRSVEKIHKILHCNTSDRDGLQFRSVFTGKEQYLDCHKTERGYMFPEAKYLEMFVVAFNLLSGREPDNAVILNSVKWGEKLVFTQPDIGTTVDVDADPEKGHDIDLLISSKSPSLDQIDHCRATGRLLDPITAANDLDEIKVRCTERIKKKNITSIPEQRSRISKYIKTIKKGNDEYLVRVSLSSFEQNVWSNWLQFFVTLSGQLYNYEKGTNLTRWTLDSLDSMSFYQIPNQQSGDIWALFSIGSPDARKDRFQCSIHLIGESGNSLISISGLHMYRGSGLSYESELQPDLVTSSQGFEIVETVQCKLNSNTFHDTDQQSTQLTQDTVFFCDILSRKEFLEFEKLNPKLTCLQFQKTLANNASTTYLEFVSRVLEICKGDHHSSDNRTRTLQIVVPSDSKGDLYRGAMEALGGQHGKHSRCTVQVINVNSHEVDPGHLHSRLNDYVNRSHTNKICFYHNQIPFTLVQQVNSKGKYESSLSMFKNEGIYLVVAGIDTTFYGSLFSNIAERTNSKIVIVVSDRISDSLINKLEVQSNVVSVYGIDLMSDKMTSDCLQGINEKLGVPNGVVISASGLFGICKSDDNTGKTGLNESARAFSILDNISTATKDWRLDFYSVLDLPVPSNVPEKYSVGLQSCISYLKEQAGTLHRKRVFKYIKVYEKKNTYEEIFGKSLQLDASCIEIKRSVQDVLLDQIAPDISTEDILCYVDEFLKESMVSLLKVDSEKVDFDCRLNEFGFNSVSIVEFTKVVNDKLDTDIKPAIFFEHQTMKSFRKYLVAEHRSEVKRAMNIHSSTTGKVVAKCIVKDKQVDIKTNNIPSRRAVPKSTRISKNFDNRIAIIGITGKFPNANNLDEFWCNLENGKDCIDEIPSDRWDWKKIYGDPELDPYKTRIKWGGFLSDVYQFDPLFFGISPKEALMMDPQQRLTMMGVWNAIEDAGYDPEKLAGSKTGLFVGTASSGYNDLIARSGVAQDDFGATGMVPSLGPNRMSYFLDLAGPSEPVETSCSSSLVAIIRAIQSIQLGACDMAVAGGVNTIVTPWAHISLGKTGMLSADGRCKTFSDTANGYVRGEGVGMVVMKPLEKAVSDGDHIYGIVSGSAENHGGRANSLTAPNPIAQSELLIDAYTKAGINPGSVSYIETHGTGTELGDPIEINGLKNAFEILGKDSLEVTPESGYCALGSVKTNIGHLELAAGVAGVIKVLLQLKNNKLVKNVHLESVNPYIELENSPFYLLKNNKKWVNKYDEKGRTLPRCAGVSSFGFGGVNAHIIIEDYISESRTRNKFQKSEPQLIVLSAKNSNTLHRYVEKFVAYINKVIDTDTTPDLHKIAFTLQTGRSPMGERLAILSDSINDLSDNLNQYLTGTFDSNVVFRGSAESNEVEEKYKSAMGDAREIAAAWVGGGRVSWENLYDINNLPGRVPLPTYPFDCQEYYFPDANKYSTLCVNDLGAQGATIRATDSDGIIEHIDKKISRLSDLTCGDISVDPITYQATAESQRMIANLYLLKVLRSAGIFTQISEGYTREDVQRKLDIVPGYVKLLDAALTILHKNGYIEYSDDKWFASETMFSESMIDQVNRVSKLQQELTLKTPETKPFMRLLEVCMNSFREVVSGKRSYIDVLFPNGNMDLVTGLDCGSEILDYYNYVSANLINAYVRKKLEINPGKVIKILEYSSGNSGAVAVILNALNEFGNDIEVHCTAATADLLQSQIEKYQDTYHFTRFKVLSIEDDLRKQGYECYTYDLIYCGNSLSSARSIDQGIQKLKHLLREKGMLFVKEMTRVQEFSTLTFGLVGSWWHAKDSDQRLSDSPLLSKNMWQNRLKLNDFDQVRIVGPDQIGKESTFQHILIARNCGELEVDSKQIGKEISRSEDISNVVSSQSPPEESSESPGSVDGSPLENMVASVWEEVLGVKGVGLSESFFDLGGSSLVITQIISRIKKKFPVELTLLNLFEASTIAGMAELVEEEILSKIEELDTEEVARLLA